MPVDPFQSCHIDQRYFIYNGSKLHSQYELANAERSTFLFATNMVISVNKRVMISNRLNKNKRINRN